MRANSRKDNISANWRSVKLAAIFEFKNGLNKEKKYFGQGTPIINYMDVNRGGGLYRDNVLGRVQSSKSELKRFNVEKGDVFFTRTSETLKEIGFSAVALDNFKDTVFSGFVLRARPKKGFLLPEYSKFCFVSQSVRKEIIQKSSYTTRALTSGSSLNQVSIDLPSLLEQKRIVAVLEAWDKYLELLDRKIEIKKNIKKGLMQQLLTGKKRLKGFSDKWKVMRLGDVGNITSGGTPSKAKSKYWQGKFPWISSSDLIEGNITHVKVSRFITEEAIVNSATKLIPKESVIIVSRVGLGKLIVNQVSLCTSQDFLCLVVDEKKMYSSYFLGYLLIRKIREFLVKNQGTSIKGILKKDLENLQIEIPELKKEQVGISNILINSDIEIKLLEKKKHAIEAKKKYLLNNLITGKIRTPENLTVRAS